MPKISVIMPAYNSESTIERSIESVLNQSFNDWELIVVDNGSTDDTVTLVSKMKDDRIKLVHSEPGRSVARNVGITLADSELLVLLDSDDTLQEDHIKRGVKWLSNHPEDVAYIDNSLLMIGDQLIGNVTNLKEKNSNDLLIQNFIHISAPVFRRKNVSLFHENLEFNEDWLFWAENFVNKRVRIDVNSIGSFKYITGENTMFDRRMLATEIYVYAALKNRFNISKITDKKKLFLIFLYLHMRDKLDAAFDFVIFKAYPVTFTAAKVVFKSRYVRQKISERAEKISPIYEKLTKKASKL